MDLDTYQRIAVGACNARQLVDAAVKQTLARELLQLVQRASEAGMSLEEVATESLKQAPARAN